MLEPIFAPALAFPFDYFSQVLKLRKATIFLFIVLLTLPSLMIWLSGYHFASSRCGPFFISLLW